MFYRAALGLPFFAWGTVSTALGTGALGLGGAEASAPAAAVVVVAGVAVPRLYLLLAGNVVGDYCCKVSMPRMMPRRTPYAAPSHPSLCHPAAVPPTLGCTATKRAWRGSGPNPVH